MWFSPCVTFNDHGGSSQELQLHEGSTNSCCTSWIIVPHYEDIAVEIPEGGFKDVQKNDG